MEKTEREFKWVTSLKEAAKRKGLLPVSNIEYLRKAIQCRGETSRAVNELENEQKDRAEVKMLESEKDGAIALINRCSPIFPRILGRLSKPGTRRNTRALDILDTPVLLNAMIAVVKIFNPTKVNDMMKMQQVATEKKLNREESESFKKVKSIFERSVQKS